MRYTDFLDAIAKQNSDDVNLKIKSYDVAVLSLHDLRAAFSDFEITNIKPFLRKNNKSHLDIIKFCEALRLFWDMLDEQCRKIEDMHTIAQTNDNITLNSYISALETHMKFYKNGIDLLLIKLCCMQDFAKLVYKQDEMHQLKEYFSITMQQIMHYYSQHYV
jgi:hypothetical protein